jgi:methylmalonyl-CoA mutase
VLCHLEIEHEVGLFTGAGSALAAAPNLAGMTDQVSGEVAGGLDEPEELQPEQGALRLASPEDDWSRADWEQAAAAVLRRSRRLSDDDPDDAVWAALTRTTYDGVGIPPLGTRDLLDGLATSGRPTRAGPWDTRTFSTLGPEELVNRELLADLEGGATSVWVGVTRHVDFAALLDGVRLDLAPVVLSPVDDGPASARAFLEQAGRALHPRTNLGLDAARATSELADLARSAGVLGFVVNGSKVHNWGAGEAQELGWAIATGAAYLRTLEQAGVPVEEAAGLVEFRLAATDDQFATIAKLRAVRRLWARVLELSGADAVPMRLHAETSAPMTTAFDPWVNMLRGTVAAFAAGVGGADAVTVLPFDARLGRPDAFGRRIARNVSHLLVAESHVAAVTDPAGGAYAVEKLTDDLAAAGWAELGRIEDDGDDAFIDRVRVVAARRREDIARRRVPITGVSEFPNLGETLPERGVDVDLDGAPSYAEEFELMRLSPPQAHVFLATLGPVAAHTVRAGFASNLLAAGGIAVDVAGPTDVVDDLVAAYDGQSVICLAGTDAAYDAWGAEAAEGLRRAGARHVVVAGTSLAWADDSCAVGVDAVDFLTRTRELLA